MKDNIKKYFYRIIQIKKHIVIFNIMIDKIVKKPEINDSIKTIEEIVNNNYSISRYGDGEFKLIDGEDLLFQKYDKSLANRLKEILISNEEKHLVCIPKQIISTDWLNDRAKYFWDNYLSLNRYKLYKLIDNNKVYYDSFITRFYMDYKDKSQSKNILNNLKKIWYKKNVVMVEGEESRLGVGNDLFDECLSIERIICPKKNSYTKYKDILESVRNNVTKDKLILIALGPTATVLAYDLSKLGYTALDIGHVDIEYEWFLKKADRKIDIKNKYVGEVLNGNYSDAISDSRYLKQIISTI